MQNQQNPMTALEAKQQNTIGGIRIMTPEEASRPDNVTEQTKDTPALCEFTRLYEKATKLEFNPAWSNGTGYFDGAVNGPNAPKDLDNKKIYSFEVESGRKGLIFPTRYGNVVAFQRYHNARHIIAANMPRPVEIFFHGGRPLNEDELRVLGGGDWGFPIGVAIESSFSYEERRKKYEVTGATEDHPDLDGWKEVQG